MTLRELWDAVGALPPDTPVLIGATEYGLDYPSRVEVKTVAQVRERKAWAGPYDTEFDLMEHVVGEPFLAVVVR